MSDVFEIGTIVKIVNPHWNCFDMPKGEYFGVVVGSAMEDDVAPHFFVNWIGGGKHYTHYNDTYDYATHPDVDEIHVIGRVNDPQSQSG